VTNTINPIVKNARLTFVIDIRQLFNSSDEVVLDDVTYVTSLEFITTLLENTHDVYGESENRLIELVIVAIEKYEDNLPEVKEWIRKTSEC